MKKNSIADVAVELIPFAFERKRERENNILHTQAFEKKTLAKCKISGEGF